MTVARDKLTVGDRVTVTFTGNLQVQDRRSYAACIEVTDDHGWQHWIYPNSEHVTIEVVKPDFDPKTGEIYQVGSGRWMTVNNGFGTGPQGMISHAGVRFTIEQFARDFPYAKKV